MKRAFRYLAVIAIMSLLPSCAALNISFKPNVEALKATRKVALISFMSEDSVDTSQVTEFSALSLGTQAIQGDCLVLNDKITGVKTNFLRRAKLPFKMVSERRVIKKGSYRSIDDSKMRRANSMIVPKGYKHIANNEKAKIAQALKGVKEADAAMMVVMKTNLYKSSTILGVAGTTKIMCSMGISLYDRNGNIISNKSVNGKSNTSALQYKGAYDGRNIRKMVDEATAKCLKEYAAYMKNTLKG